MSEAMKSQYKKALAELEAYLTKGEADNRERAREGFWANEKGNAFVNQRRWQEAEARCSSALVVLTADVDRHIQASNQFNQALTAEAARIRAEEKRHSAAEPSLPMAAADLVNMLNAVSKHLELPKGPPTDRELASLNCQRFFRALGQQLSATQTQSWEKDFLGLNADEIIAKIDTVACQGGGQWEKIGGKIPEESWRKAQELANRGAIVVGGSRTSSKNPHGHLGIVFPVPPGLDASRFSGSGPFVRDGNEHIPEQDPRLYPTTWGAVKASKAFPRSRTNWYVWLPSKQ